MLVTGSSRFTRSDSLQTTNRVVNKSHVLFPKAQLQYATFPGLDHVPTMFVSQRVWMYHQRHCRTPSFLYSINIATILSGEVGTRVHEVIRRNYQNSAISQSFEECNHSAHIVPEPHGYLPL